ALVCGGRGLDRVVHVLRPRGRELAQHIAGRGVGVAEGAPRACGDAAPADQVRELLRHRASPVRTLRTEPAPKRGSTCGPEDGPSEKGQATLRAAGARSKGQERD